MGSFPGLTKGMIVALFQIAGILQWDMQELKSWVRKDMPKGPKCFRKIGAKRSGSRALELLDLETADQT